MSESISVTLESGPGSYNIQDSFGHISYKYYNSPRAVIAKAEKTNKLFLGVELNKQLSGQDSPGVNTYNPNRDKVLSKSPSASFGKEERVMSHIKPFLNRSPGPVYNLKDNHSNGVSFTKARRSSSIEPIFPAPWDYNPIIPVRIPSVIMKATYERNIGKFLTPGPGSYLVKDLSVRGAYVSKVGRNIMQTRDISPAPGQYHVNSNKHSFKASFGSCKRNMDPRDCNFYLDAKSYEYYRAGKD